MPVKSAVGVFMPGTHNSLIMVLLPLVPGLIPKKSSRPGQLKTLNNIQDTGENRDVQGSIAKPLQNIDGTTHDGDFHRLRQR